MDALAQHEPESAVPSPHPGNSYPVPDKPIITIEPGRAWSTQSLADLWAYRELLYFLIWRDVKVRYKQTALGAAWAILQPLVTMLIFAYFFGVLARMPSDGAPYSLFALAGLLPWTFFSNAVTSSGSSIIGNANLITKVYFPRIIIPTAAVGSGLLDFAIASTLLIPLMIYFEFAPTLNLLMLPALAVLTTLFALGVGFFIASLNVRYRDVRYALPFTIQVWFFLTPIIYPSSLVPEQLRTLLAINPMTGIIEGFRDALFGREFDWIGLLTATGVILFVLFYSSYRFKRLERSFAEFI